MEYDDNTTYWIDPWLNTLAWFFFRPRWRIQMTIEGSNLIFHYTGAGGWTMKKSDALLFRKRPGKRTLKFLISRGSYPIPPITGVGGIGSTLQATVTIMLIRDKKN